MIAENREKFFSFLLRRAINSQRFLEFTREDLRAAELEDAVEDER